MAGQPHRDRPVLAQRPDGIGGLAAHGHAVVWLQRSNDGGEPTSLLQHEGEKTVLIYLHLHKYVLLDIQRVRLF